MTAPKDASTLVLFPTEAERAHVSRHVDLNQAGVQAAICGFGPVAAAARAAQLIASCQPQCVLLLGIAGTYDPDQLPVGTASSFFEVVIDGIGVGAGADFVTARDVGFAQWADEELVVNERLGLHCPRKLKSTRQLLTCCAASASADEAKTKRARHTDAVAEDMEGFGVATACALAHRPLSIIRGISNVAGDRDKTNWQIDAALEAAAWLARKLLHSNETWEPHA